MTEPNSRLAKRRAHLQQLVELCVLVMVANLACCWEHCEQEWCAQRLSRVFKSLRAERSPLYRQQLRQQLCTLLFLEGKDTLHSGQLWTSSRAAPSRVCSPQAYSSLCVSHAPLQGCVPDISRALQAATPLDSSMVLLLPQPRHPAWALGDS